MECKDCARFNAEKKECLDQKLNPADWGSAVIVANAMGVRAICAFNDYRERLIRARLQTNERMAGDIRRRPTRKLGPFPRTLEREGG